MTIKKDPADYDAVVDIVRSWPSPQRFMLVQEVLATLAPDSPSTSRGRPTLARARGLLATQHPAPTDTEIESLLEQRRQERYDS